MRRQIRQIRTETRCGRGGGAQGGAGAPLDAPPEAPLEPPLDTSIETPLSQPRRFAGLWIFLGLCCAAELLLEAADAGLLGSPLWRSTAYQYGAFWAGLLYGWQPNYPAQPWLMFASYAFLHGGFWHLAGNMAVLCLLGGPVQRQAGPWGFALICAAAALGGAAAFAVLAPSPLPMVGASGVLFGLAGALQAWTWSARRRRGLSLAPVWRALAGLAALNLLFWVLLQGMLAWQTHLGGFLAGWAAAALLARRQPG